MRPSSATISSGVRPISAISVAFKTSGPGRTAAAVEDHVVHAGLQPEVEVALDVLGGQLEPDRNPVCAFTDLIGQLPEVSRGHHIGEARRGTGGQQGRLKPFDHSLLCGAVALVASYVPALRASTLDPVQALRNE